MYLEIVQTWLHHRDLVGLVVERAGAGEQRRGRRHIAGRGRREVGARRGHGVTRRRQEVRRLGRLLGNLAVGNF